MNNWSNKKLAILFFIISAICYVTAALWAIMGERTSFVIWFLISTVELVCAINWLRKARQEKEDNDKKDK